MIAHRIVLASTSPYRRALLERLQIPFETADPAVDERRLPDETPEQTATRLAHDKASAVAARYPDAWIIGSDQVACLGDEIFGKPGSFENAVEQLKKMRGQTICFHTGLCLLDARHNTARIRRVTTRVTFRNLTDAAIENYLRKEQPYHCAGSAKSEALGIALTAKIDTDDPTALIGLPLITLNELLLAEGIDVLMG